MNEGLILTELFDRFRDPEFVKSNSHLFDENGKLMYAFKMHVKTKLLGEITFGSVYFPSKANAFPLLFLTEEQVLTLRNTGILLTFRRRKSEASDNKIYLSFPTRADVERIENMNV